MVSRTRIRLPMNKRDTSIDIVKAIGILLMILGHCVEIPHRARHFIFTFHMPLFFLISGFFYKKKTCKASLKSDVKTLLIPYMLTCCAIVLFFFLLGIGNNDFGQFKYYFWATFLGSGTKHSALYFSDLPDIGAIWFLPALLVCKNVYNLISSFNISIRLIFSSLIFVIATLIGRYLLFIPFSILSGLSAIVFYAIGDFYKKKPIIKPKHWLIGVACWGIAFFYSHLNLADPRVDLYFIDVIGATTATLCVYYLSRSIKKTSIAQVLSWIGCNSMYILCFHNIDFKIGLTHRLAYNNVSSIALSILVPLIFTFLFRLYRSRLSLIKLNINKNGQKEGKK